MRQKHEPWNMESGGNYMKQFKLNSRWFIVCGIALAVIIAGSASYYVAQHKLIEQESVKNEQLVKQETKLTDIQKIDQLSADKDKEETIYITMHKMINTKIVAVDNQIWGEINITPEGCDKLIKEINASKQLDKVELVLFLTHWKAGNFEDGVKEHNYLWEKLDGIQGRASALR